MEQQQKKLFDRILQLTTERDQLKAQYDSKAAEYKNIFSIRATHESDPALANRALHVRPGGSSTDNKVSNRLLLGYQQLFIIETIYTGSTYHCICAVFHGRQASCMI